MVYYDEDVWGVFNYLVLEFWVECNIKYVEEKDDLGNVSWKWVFDMFGCFGLYFLYGMFIFNCVIVSVI